VNQAGKGANEKNKGQLHGRRARHPFVLVGIRRPRAVATIARLLSCLFILFRPVVGNGVDLIGVVIVLGVFDLIGRLFLFFLFVLLQSLVDRDAAAQETVRVRRRR
jgi:hypothetical protein